MKTLGAPKITEEGHGETEPLRRDEGVKQPFLSYPQSVQSLSCVRL